MKISVNNIEFEVLDENNQFFWHSLNMGKWEPQSFHIIDRFVEREMVALDIGCWIGPLSFYMAGKGVQVFAIEPDAVAYGEFLKNLELNPQLDAAIHPYKLAITPESGDIRLYARSLYGASTSSSLHRVGDKTSTAKAKGLNLAAFLELSQLEYCDFIKMDVEGAEFDLLPSMVQDIEKLGLPTIYISFHSYLLNEAIYQRKIGHRLLAQTLIKLERFLKIRFFKSTMNRTLEKTRAILEKYPYIYTDEGKNALVKEVITRLQTDEQLNIVLSTRPW